MKKRKGNFLERISSWYEGVYIPCENNQGDSVYVVGGWFRRHWTARFLRAVVDFHIHIKEWKWALPFYVALGALLVKL